MKEDLLHYLWKFRKFRISDLQTVDGKTIQILNPGIHNTDSGPDFFNGQIRINRQKWAGNIELHLASSDWYQHHHHSDSAYDNVILHVVWKFDKVVKRYDGTTIPTLELRRYVNKRLLEKYSQLASAYLSWIPCEHDLGRVGKLTLQSQLERSFLDRLEVKARRIDKELSSLHGDWEALMFRVMNKAFGAKVNGDAMYSMAASFPFKLVRKYRYDREALEALLMGQAGLLSGLCNDHYFIKLKEIYGYLKLKHDLVNTHVIPPKFFRIRPSGFPTIRISQLASLYGKHHHMFARLMDADSVEELYSTLDVCTSEYWETHYRFSKEAKYGNRRLSRNFIDTVIINAIIPIRFCYEQAMGRDISQQIIDLMTEIRPESNSVIRKFNELGVTAENAFESQALLQLKSSFCDHSRCLKCRVGNALLMSNMQLIS